MRHIKPLDQGAIRASRPEFLIGVTNVKTGEGEFIDAKDGVDIVTAVVASSALPVVYNQTKNINGNEYGGGALGNGIPIREAIDKGCTDILVILNNTLEGKAGKTNFLEKVLVSLYMRGFTPEYRAAMLKRHGQYQRASEVIEIHGDSVNIGVIAPSTMPISRISQDSQKIYRLAWLAKIKHWNYLLLKNHKSKINPVQKDKALRRLLR